MCLRSSVMALVSFVGPLVSAEMTKVSPDKWYLWFSPQHPPWTGHGVVRVPTASSWCKDMCTVTFGLTTGFESFCKDQTECLTKPADGKSFLCLGDAQSVGFLRVLRGEQRGNWHGGELLHELWPHAPGSSHPGHLRNLSTELRSEKMAGPAKPCPW